MNGDPAYVKEGKGSGQITYPGSKPGGLLSCIRVPVDRKDWSNLDVFSVWIYAPQRTNDKLGIRLFVDGEEHKYSYDFSVDWQGWKEVRVPFRQFQVTGRPAWDRVQEIALPQVEGKAGTYYVDDMKAFRAGP